MWLPRQLTSLAANTDPVVLLGGEPYGVPFVIDALRATERLAWLALPARSRDDAVGQGNALAAAVNGMLETQLFAQALPYPTHLQALAHHRDDLLPLWIAVSCDETHAAFLADLIALGRSGYGVLVDLRMSDPFAPLPAFAADCLVLGPEQLAVRLEEAPQVVPGGLGADQVEAMWLESGGRFTDLVTRAHREARLPLLRMPAAQGPLLPLVEAESVEPSLLVRALQRDGNHLEALELAVLRAPALVEEVLKRAGPAYQEQGLLSRLHLLLSAVPSPYATRERVLEWRLVAALAEDDLPSVVPDVDAHLNAFAAPELRARRAGTTSWAKGFAMAQAAAEHRRTPLTLWQFGRMHPDPERAVELLKESVEVAEDLGTPYDLARNAGTLAARFLQSGEFSRAASWSHWALQVFHQHQLRDGSRRLRLFNELAVARILTGDVAGLRQGLEEGRASLDGVLPQLASLFRSTLAYLELAEGRGEAAVALLRGSYEASERRNRGRYAAQYVRALNETRLFEQAAQVATEAVQLNEDFQDFRRTDALLARGMARSALWAAGMGRAGDDDAAADDLLEVMLTQDREAERRLPAALHFLLVRPGAAHQLPEDLASLLTTLHPMALRVFSGPSELFQPVWDTLIPAEAGLRLSFFGETAALLDGREAKLPLRMAEIALALALHPEGMSLDQINDFLTPDGRQPFSGGGLRSLLTRLRASLPVSDAPYRFDVPVQADVLRVRSYLDKGRVREALSLLRGPLLPESEAPGVEELRWSLEEDLRQAVLMGADPDALFDLADRLGDDLELWEATAAALPDGEPRLALARARVRRLGREYQASMRN